LVKWGNKTEGEEDQELEDHLKRNFEVSEGILTIKLKELGIMEFWVKVVADYNRTAYQHFWFNITTPPPPPQNYAPLFDE
jgi:hypothetical protein